MLKSFCVVLLWEPNQQVKWVPVPCEMKMLTPVLICQQEDTTHDKEVVQKGDNLVVYVNGESYPWTMESCYPNRTYVTRVTYLETGVYYICKDGSLEATNALNIAHHRRVHSTLTRLLADTCEVTTLRVPLCINLIRDVEPVNQADTNMAMTLENGLLHSSNVTCGKHWVGFNRCCYLPQLETTGDVSLAEQSHTIVCGSGTMEHDFRNALYSYSLPVEFNITHPLEVEHDLSCGYGEFTCTNGECVSQWVVLDGATDCLDGTDEGVVHTVCMYTTTNRAQHMADCSYCSPGNCTCSVYYFQCSSGGCIPWYQYCDGTSHCSDGQDEAGCSLVSAPVNTVTPRPLAKDIYVSCLESNVYRCHFSNVCIPIERYNDGRPDCPVSTPHTETWSTFYIETPLPLIYKAEDEDGTHLTGECGPGYIRCPYDFTGTCFPFDKICLYDADQVGRMTPCPNGGHLLHCASVHCTGLFKCHQAYCLPLRRMCDGRPDCPAGEDEEGCPAEVRCPGLLRCKEGGCVHPRHVCDGYRDCQRHGEDEMHCDRAVCPLDCQCHASSIYCHGGVLTTVDCSHYKYVSITTNRGTLLSLVHTESLLFVTISYSDVSHDTLFQGLRTATNLDVSQNGLKHVTMSYLLGVDSLRHLNMSHNSISKVDKEAFWNKYNLLTLDLSNNHLQALHRETFIYAIKLKHLYLSSNSLLSFSLPMNLQEPLETLDLSDNTLRYADGLENLTINQVLADNSHICCVLNATQCIVYQLSAVCKSEFALYEAILLYIIGSTLTLSAMLSLVWRSYSKMPVDSIAHLHKDVCSVMVGMHLVLAGSINFASGDKLPAGGGTSLYCVGLSLLQAVAFLAQPLMTVVYIISLYIVTKYWSRHKSEIKKFIRSLIILIWFVEGLLALLASVLQHAFNQILDLGLTCTLLTTQLRGMLGWVISPVVLVVYVLSCILLLILAYEVVSEVNRSSAALVSYGASKVATGKLKKLVRNLSISLLPPMMLSLPMVLCVALSLCGVVIPPSHEFILTVFVFPLPSIMNVIYSIKDTKARGQ